MSPFAIGQLLPFSQRKSVGFNWSMLCILSKNANNIDAKLFIAGLKSHDQPLFAMQDGRSFQLHLHLNSAVASSSGGQAAPIPLQNHVPAPPVLVIPQDDDDDSDHSAID